MSIKLIHGQMILEGTIGEAQLEGGSAYQPLDSDLTSIAALGSAAGRMLYTTDAHVWAEAVITSAGLALLDDADAAAQRTTLGLGSIATYAGDQNLAQANSPTFAGLTISTSGKINFRDADISIGSTISDGILEISADVSINMFYDNADVGDEVDGQSFYIWRRAAEGDNCLQFYINQYRQAQIKGEALALDVGILGGAYLRFSGWDIRSAANFKITSDSLKLFLGSGNDATIQYDGTNMIIDPAVVGTGTLIVSGKFEVETSPTEGHQAVTIDQNDADQAFIDYQGTSAANITNSITSWKTGAFLTGYIRVEINTCIYWMPYYTAPSGP